MLWLLACETPVEDLPAPNEGGVVTCETPEARATAPFSEWDPGADWGTQTVGSTSFGGGLVVADLTGDALLDIYLPVDGPDQLFVAQADGSYVDETSTRMPSEYAPSDSATAADADGDGDLDLYVGNRGPNALYRNDDGVFTEVDAGADDGDHYTPGSAWGDMDGDGDLDLLVMNHRKDGVPVADLVAGERPEPDGNGLYQNDGGFSFTSRVDLLGEDGHDAYTFAGGWHDVNADGNLDQYFVNDMGPMYRPNLARAGDGAGNFVSLEQSGLEISTFGMGVGVGDLNGDGVSDFLVTGWDQLSLVVSAPDGRWYESSAALGLIPEGERHIAWGAELADVDNDGDLDATIAYGKLVMPEEEEAVFEDELGLVNPTEQPDGLWLQGSDGMFSQVADDWGVAQRGIGRGFVLADLDGNGFLDIVKRDLAGPAQVFLGACDESSWLTVVPRQDTGNPFAIGAKVVVEAGGTTQERYVRAGGTSYGSSGPPEVYFGLGSADTVDTLTVYWPDGETSVFGSFDARQRVVAER